MSRADCIVVGAGLSGLACARLLAKSGARVLVLEAADGVGGRVRTDRVDGFLLDRGFQAFSTAYPEAAKVWDVGVLKLQPFAPGVRVFFNGRFHSVADPFRQPMEALATALGPVGTLPDKLKLFRLRAQSRMGPLDELLRKPQETTLERLKRLGFSDALVERFFRPFLGSVFLESELTTSSRMLEFEMRMASEGALALPAGGMQTLPEWLAAQLPPGSVRLSTVVGRVAPQSVELESGERLEADHVVVATDAVQASRLLPAFAARGSCGTTCVYFAAPEPPYRGPHLLLNGEARGPVNHLAVLSEVSPSYAPQGQALISASLIGARPAELDPADSVREHLESWFGPQVRRWRHLRTYVIENALPVQSPGVFAPGQPTRLPSGVFICGDHREHGTLEGALISGRRAAEAVLGRAA